MTRVNISTDNTSTGWIAMLWNLRKGYYEGGFCGTGRTQAEAIGELMSKLWLADVLHTFIFIDISTENNE